MPGRCLLQDLGRGIEGSGCRRPRGAREGPAGRPGGGSGREACAYHASSLVLPPPPPSDPSASLFQGFPNILFVPITRFFGQLVNTQLVFPTVVSYIAAAVETPITSFVERGKPASPLHWALLQNHPRLTVNLD